MKACVLIGLVATASAYNHQLFDTTWQAGPSTAWNTPSQWSTGYLPLPCATATITAEVAVTSDQEVDELILAVGGDLAIGVGAEFKVMGDTTASCCDSPPSGGEGLGHTLDLANRQCKVITAFPTTYPTAAPTIHPTRRTPTADELATHTSTCKTTVTFDWLEWRHSFTDSVEAACEQAFAAELGGDVHADMVSCTAATQDTTGTSLQVDVHVTGAESIMATVGGEIQAISGSTPAAIAAQQKFADLMNHELRKFANRYISEIVTGTSCTEPVFETGAPTTFPTAYPTASPTWAPTTDWNPTDGQYCPKGHFMSTCDKNITSGTGGFTYDALQGEHMCCKKCPRGESSNGGFSPVCHTIAATWSPCSHMACKVTRRRTCLHNRFDSLTIPNPKEHVAAGNVVPTKCAADDATAADAEAANADYQTHDGVNWGQNFTHVEVYHHGFENHGTIHRCAAVPLTAAQVASGMTHLERTCECECRDGDHENDGHAAIDAADPIHNFDSAEHMAHDHEYTSDTRSGNGYPN